jgi:MFS family permease
MTARPPASAPPPGGATPGDTAGAPPLASDPSVDGGETSPGADGEGPSSAFAYGAYRRYWVGTFAAVFGERFRFIAGGWLVLELTGSPFWLGVVALAQAVPTILLSVPAGALADRVESRRIVAATHGVIAVSHLAIALLTIVGLVELWMVIVWAMTVGTLAAGSTTAQNVLLPRLVERPAMASAVAYSSAIWQTTRVIGPAVAGLSVAAIGSGPSLMAAAVGYALAAVTIGTLSLRPRPTDLDEQSGGMWEGARYIARHRIFLAVTGLSFFTSMFGASYMILLPVFAFDVLGEGARGFGMLEAAAGLGALAGTLAVVRMGVGRYTGHAMLGGAFLFGLFIAAFAMTRSLPLAMALLLGAGLTQSLYLNLAMTTVQLLVPDELRGRVMGVWSMTWFLIMVGGFLSGTAATLLGTPTTIAIGALSVSAFSVAVFALVPELRQQRFAMPEARR